MLYLAIDTSTNVLSVAVANDETIIAEYTTNMKKDHAVRLMPAIESMLATTNIKTNDLTAIFVANGPGSYTGLRIGVSTAKAMAWALNVPVVGISSLELIARSVKLFGGIICPIIDARRGQVFTGLYSNFNENKQLHWNMIEPDRIILMTDWVEYIRENYINKPVIFTGPDIKLHKELINITPQLYMADSASQLSRAAELIELGKSRLNSGLTDDPKELAPEYLRLAEAEYNLLK